MGVGVTDQTGAFSDVETPRSAQLRSDLSNSQVREVGENILKNISVNMMPYKLKNERPAGTILQG